MCIHLSTPPLGRLLQISQVQPGFRQVRPIFRGRSFHLLKVQQLVRNNIFLWMSSKCSCNNYFYWESASNTSVSVYLTYLLIARAFLLLWIIRIILSEELQSTKHLKKKLKIRHKLRYFDCKTQQYGSGPLQFFLQCYQFKL